MPLLSLISKKINYKSIPSLFLLAVLGFLSPVYAGNGGVVTTLAGSGVKGSANGSGTAASFNEPWGIAVDLSGNVYVGDQGNHLVRKITPNGLVTTLAGSAGVTGATNGTGTAALFSYPRGVAVDSFGNVYVTENGNSLIRKITPDGVVTTLAGGGLGAATNKTGTAASFTYPNGVAVDKSGKVYIADSLNCLVRQITMEGVVSTLAGGEMGSADGIGPAASFYQPDGIAVDHSGNIYVADSFNNQIRKITTGGVVTTLAGAGPEVEGSANGKGKAASFNLPDAVAVDASGNVYVADSGNSLIREITPRGLVTTFAGSAGVTGATNGIGSAASFNNPEGITIDNIGNIYVVDTGNNLIRKIQ